VFRDLHKLEVGNDIYLWVGDIPYRYRVSAQYRLPVEGAPAEVREKNLRWILPTDDQRLTLVTCWPPWSNTHRTVIVAFPVPWNP
jgi:sortase A